MGLKKNYDELTGSPEFSEGLTVTGGTLELSNAELQTSGETIRNNTAPTSSGNTVYQGTVDGSGASYPRFTKTEYEFLSLATDTTHNLTDVGFGRHQGILIVNGDASDGSSDSFTDVLVLSYNGYSVMGQANDNSAPSRSYSYSSGWRFQITLSSGGSPNYDLRMDVIL